MNLSIKEALVYVKALNKDLKNSKQQVAIAAPFTFLPSLAGALKSTKIALVAQNVGEMPGGAFTGEISASMLAELGITYCLAGHSERRIYYKETDEMVNNKVKQLLSKKITAILCLSETDEERQRGLTSEVIKHQLKIGLTDIKNLAKIVIAYEPVWAISTFQKSALKMSATIDQIEEAHLLIKRELVNLFGPAGKRVKVLYGGSVAPPNASEILNSAFIDGALVGGASLKEKDFLAIINSVK